MLTWRAAHEIAHLAASRAHATLEVDLTAGFVDVAQSIHRAGAHLMWQQMPHLFGAYLNEPGSTPGILVNNGLPYAAQRFTAAHELGHLFLNHTTSVEDGSTIDITHDPIQDYMPDKKGRDWPDQEKLAESFAAWFLMPRRLVLQTVRKIGLSKISAPVDVYRISQILGTPYRTTVNHLPNLRVISKQQAERWSHASLSRIKEILDHEFEKPASRRYDVALVTPAMAGTIVRVQPHDRLLVHAARVELTAPAEFASLTPKSSDSPSRPEHIGFQVSPLDCSTIALRAHSISGPAWTVGVHVTQTQSGLYRGAL
ncbi:hypothetical protein CH259_00440 [Rhodococcus sp. 05-2254-4]|nr:hypothetical protein CH259_00440 [Rhodococcus sp. 05-2254-4]OZE47343.1 hypothetical protein CH261_10200 [Rhodococcus sp. 05-2254-3]OZE47642.1 hypothetical protein CH283_18315 [Rhodococcus sp. 05-2254-2]